MFSRLCYRYDRTATTLLRKILVRNIPASASPTTTERYNSTQLVYESSDNGHDHRGKNHGWKPRAKMALGVAVAGTCLGLKLLTEYRTSVECEVPNDGDVELVEKKIYSRAEVGERKTLENGVWVIYGHEVYDITEFIASHPGGAEKILLAAGGNLEPYWNMYAQHKKQEVYDLLAEYHVGQLRKEDWVGASLVILSAWIFDL